MLLDVCVSSTTEGCPPLSQPAAGRGHASTSGASAKRKEFGYQKPPSKRKKSNSLKDKDDLSDSSMSVIEEWTDEPNVCMFCDDGVEGDHKLLW